MKRTEAEKRELKRNGGGGEGGQRELKRNGGEQRELMRNGAGAKRGNES